MMAEIGSLPDGSNRKLPLDCSRETGQIAPSKKLRVNFRLLDAADDVPNNTAYDGRDVDWALEPAVLRPFHRSEAIMVSEAAEIARRSKRTIRDWCQLHDIGRRIGQWMVSRVALAMWLDGDQAALAAYLSGDRTSPIVIEYYQRLGVPVPRTREAQQASVSASENNNYRNQSRCEYRASLQNKANYSLTRQRGEVAK